MKHEYNPNVQDEGDPELIRAEAEYQNRIIDEQVAQRWVMVYGFIIGFVVLAALTPALDSVLRPYPQVMFIVAAVVAIVALCTATRSRDKWADILLVASTLLMLFSLMSITPFGARVMEAIDPPDGVDPGTMASTLQNWLIAMGIAMVLLLAVAWLSREWVLDRRRWFIRFVLIWSIVIGVLTFGFLAAVVVMG